MRFLNGFVLIGIVLALISIGGLITHNRLLTEAGQAVNPYAWLQYMGAAVLMFINGVVSIRNAEKQEPSHPSPAAEQSAE